MESFRLRFETVRGIAELSRPGLIEAWGALSARVSPALAGPAWFVPWLNAFGQALELRIVFCWADTAEGTHLAAVFPFHEIRKPWPLSELKYLGNEHTHRAEIALDPRWSEAAIEGFLAHAAHGLGGVELWGLGAATARGWPGEPIESQAGVGHCIELKEDWKAFLDAHSKNFRRQIKRTEQACQEAGLSFEVIRDAGSLRERLAELEAISSASWQGQNGTGTFSNPQYRAFYLDLCERAASEGRLRLDVVRSPERPIGFVLSLLDPAGGRIEALKSEFTLDSGDFFPGWQIFIRMAREGAAAGFRAIDQGTYRTGFKEQWSDRLDPRVQIRVPAAGFTGSAYRLVHGRIVPMIRTRVSAASAPASS